MGGGAQSDTQDGSPWLAPELTPPKHEQDKGALEYPLCLRKQQQDDAAVGAAWRRCEDESGATSEAYGR